MSNILFFVGFAAFLALTILGQQYVDECSQYPTCALCLNVSTEADARPNCGWCHSNIVYQDGTIGKQCADIRDKPWKCPTLYDTYQCTAGFSCNYTSGQCYQAPAGSGFDTNTTCQSHCFPTPLTYLCDTSTYQCIPCTAGDPRCQDKSTACANCKAPPGSFKCNKTASVPQCEYCVTNDTSCSDFKTACSDCVPHPPPSPPTPPPPSNTTYYTCNITTFTCVETKAGQTKAGCSAQCSNSTPSALEGTWRGFEAQHGFNFGEWDFNFTQNTALIKDYNGTLYHAQVSQGGFAIITFLDGPHAGHVWNGIQEDLNTGPETETIAVAVGDYDAPAPDSILDAMNGTNNQKVFILSRCQGWKQTCNFTSVFDSFLRLARRNVKSLYVPAPELPASYTPAQPISHPPDFCNQFMSCKECVQQHQGQISCGWCMDATIVYNDTGDSGLHCGGFVQGQAPAFYCGSGFRTEDCSGYACNYTQAQPQCIATDDGQYSNITECTQNCQQTQYAKCNQETKKCDPCTQGTPGCVFTKDECDASCALSHSRCNYTTHQCFPCDPLTDPLCTQSTGECSTSCAQSTYGVCNPTTGTCDSCDPNKGTPGCVSQCNSTCKAGLQFGCNTTTQQCYPGGNMTLNDCAAMCIQNTTDTYGCDYSNYTHPVCVKGKGSQPLSTCLDQCLAPVFAKCDTSTGNCTVCDPTTEPDCKYTKDYCQTACRPASYSGTYRGIQINQGFIRGEWDFTFFGDNTVAFEFRSPALPKYEASVSHVGTATQGSPISFKLTQAPSAGPLPVNVGDTLTGLYVSSNGEAAITQFLYLGLGLPSSPSSTFDDAMTKIEFVLVGCRDPHNCDFSPADVPEFF